MVLWFTNISVQRKSTMGRNVEKEEEEGKGVRGNFRHMAVGEKF